MATVLAFYFWHTARQDDYSYDDYVAELAKLPEIDWNDDADADGTASTNPSMQLTPSRIAFTFRDD